MTEPQPDFPAPAHRPGLFARLAHFIFNGSRTGALAFLAAIAASAVGGVTWVVHHFKGPSEGASLPKYVPLSISFAGAFLIGRLVRRFAKTAAVVTGLLVLAIGWAALASSDKETTNALKQDATWIKDHVTHAKDYLLGLLPSATGAGLGVFAGSRRGNARQLQTS